MRKHFTFYAKALRRQSTDVERILWGHLRKRRLGGAKFRRQQPIGPFIVDFVCFEKGVIIELDGGQHAEFPERDAERDQFLSANGFRVLRFWNNEVMQSLEGVLDAIWEACRDEF